MRHLITRALRPVAVLATGAVIATTLTSPAEAAAQRDTLAGGWLKQQLTDNIVVGGYLDTFTDPDDPVWVKTKDYGLTADVGFALAAVGGSDRKVRQIGTAVADEVEAWVAPAEGEVYAGSVAKAGVLAAVAGKDPRSYGGLDLVALLEDRTSDAPPTAGRIEDQSEFGDFANTIGQSFAAWLLAEAGSAEAPAALSYLLQQQCEEGYFRLNFSAQESVDQSCDAGTAEESAADTDTTALAVIHLQQLPVQDPATIAAIADATRWLKATQKDNGSFGGGPSTKASNANSTGLAAWALGEQGSCKAAKKSAAWVANLQVTGKVKGTELAGEKGAIAYDRAAFKKGKQDGIKRVDRDQWRRTSAQAARGLSFIAGC